MAEWIPRSGESGTGSETPLSDDSRGPEGETGTGSKPAEPWWRECLRHYGGQAEPDCVELIEVVYAIGDLHTRAQEMQLDFLRYLLGMALQEALEQLRAKELGSDPKPARSK